MWLCCECDSLTVTHTVCVCHRVRVTQTPVSQWLTHCQTVCVCVTDTVYSVSECQSSASVSVNQWITSDVASFCQQNNSMSHDDDRLVVLDIAYTCTVSVTVAFTTRYKIQDLLTYHRIHYLVWSAKPITHIHQSLGRVNDSQKIQVPYSTSLSWVLFRYLQRLNTTSWHAITLKHSWIYKLFTSDKIRLLYLSRNPKRN